MANSVTVIGRNVSVDVIGHGTAIPAKVDTGADRSSIWASNIHVDKDGTLSFTLFAPGSPYYTGDVIKRKSFKFAIVRSSSGHAQVRYRVMLSIRVMGKRLKTNFNLSDRSQNTFPILLGRRTLHKKFVVDVSVSDIDHRNKLRSKELYEEFLKNPRRFHKKYHLKAPR